MANQEIMNYLSENLRKGYSIDSLRQALLNEGYPVAQIEEAIQFAVVMSPGDSEAGAQSAQAGGQSQSRPVQNNQYSAVRSVTGQQGQYPPSQPAPGGPPVPISQGAGILPSKSPKKSGMGSGKKILIIILVIVVAIIALMFVLFTPSLSLFSLSMDQALNQCDETGTASCLAGTELPVDWGEAILNVEGELVSCDFVMICDTCSSCGFQIPGPACVEDWTCTNYSPENCTSGQVATRNCTDSNSCGTYTSRPTLAMVCLNNDGGCVENWTCSGWSECNQSIQTRNCTDSNSCGSVLIVPQLQQSCQSGSGGTCTVDANCTDSDTCTVDTCNITNQSCSFTPISSCIDSDSCCPSGCNVTNDTDCII